MGSREEKIELLKMLQLKDGLPHLYGHPLYQWQIDFIEAVNRMCFLTAANQGGKSAGLITKAIKWCTDPEYWAKLWGRQPTQIWYFYPSREVTAKEFTNKWEKAYLPRNDFKDSPDLGWTDIYTDQMISSIEWKNGTILYFLSYEQKPSNMQASTVDAVFFDEEPPEAHFNEMVPRTTTGGFINSGFTATLGQEYLRKTMEEKGPEEKFPKAWKRQISLYDCLTYADGSPSRIWTAEKIASETENYTSEAEIQRRIYGKFVKSEAVLFQTFSRKNSVIPPISLGSDFYFWAGVDAGSGGALNHPAAIAFVAVHKSFLFGHVVKCWRGDGIVTTSMDIIRRYVLMAGTLPVIQCSYDYAGSGTDVGIHASRLGLPFVKAKKDRATGISIVNTLLKSRMLTIFYSEADPDSHEQAKLISELTVVTSDAKKQKLKDDLTDAVRYAVCEVPWHFRMDERQVPVGPAVSIDDDDNEKERRRRGYVAPDVDGITQELMEVAEMFDGWGV